MKKLARANGIAMRQLLALFLVLVFALFVNSCNNREEKQDYLDTDCMILTYAKVKDWADAGILGTADSLKFYTSDRGPSFDTEVAAYLSSKGSTYPNNGTELARGVDCEQMLPSGTRIEITQIKLSVLGILEANGDLKKFHFIRLTPGTKLIEGELYLAYEVSVKNSAGESKVGWADPCPPLCPRDPILPLDDGTLDN